MYGNFEQITDQGFDMEEIKKQSITGKSKAHIIKEDLMVQEAQKTKAQLQLVLTRTQSQSQRDYVKQMSSSCLAKKLKEDDSDEEEKERKRLEMIQRQREKNIKYLRKQVLALTQEELN